MTSRVPDDGSRVNPGWPRLTLSEWEGTNDAIHLWSQVVGKVRMALLPMVNHWWHAPLYFDTSRGEFILPYATVQGADDPDTVLLQFFETTYQAAATVAKWERANLEVAPPPAPAR